MTTQQSPSHWSGAALGSVVLIGAAVGIALATRPEWRESAGKSLREAVVELSEALDQALFDVAENLGRGTADRVRAEMARHRLSEEAY